MLKSVEYSQARQDLKSGDVLVWRPNSIQSRIVQFATKSDFTHVGIVWKVSGRVFLIEADLRYGVRIAPLSKLGSFVWIKRDNVTWNDMMEEFALEAVGSEYSISDAIRSLYGQTKKNGRWQCAELVQDVLAHVDLPILSIKPTPINIVNYCLQTYKAELIEVNND